jgi:hypothetical protein
MAIRIKARPGESAQQLMRRFKKLCPNASSAPSAKLPNALKPVAAQPSAVNTQADSLIAC